MRRCPPLQKAVRRFWPGPELTEVQKGDHSLAGDELVDRPYSDAQPDRIADVNGVVMIPIFRRDLGQRHFVLDLGGCSCS